MKLPKTISLVFFLLLIVSGSLLAKVTLAQVPDPYVPCNEVRPNILHLFQKEFHSLRPYQASPCDEEVPETAALFCGNNLVIVDTVSAPQTTPPALDENCTPIGADRYRCTYETSNSRTIAIDLTDAELPIMGNTELVVSSQEQPDPEGLDNAEKVNEYVSWYLNGITGRAEYGLDDINNTVNFSGPIKKLLPQSIQHKYQIETIEKALAKDVNKDGESQDRSRHNQVVVCTNLLDKPTVCYGSLLRELVNKDYRLSDWDGTLIGAEIRTILINFWTLLLPDYPQEIIRDALGNVWEYKTPPLPWQDRFKDNPKKYLKAYNEWRGKTCVLIPFVNLLICHDLPVLSPSNKYADLFPYIPFSSTEDRVGLVELDSFGVQATSKDVIITNVSIKDWSPAELYFAHMQEVSELAEILQQTFVPKDGNMTGEVTGVSPRGACDLVNVRTNEGDDLFAGEIGGVLSYDAEFSCDFDRNATESACTKEAIVSLSVLTKTPLADDVWSRTVAGPSAIFKRIFPKVGPGGAILGILDIPAATKVTYTGANFAGNPGNQRSGEGAELYFPHVGGISEYFLKGIQTILRPKGYGEQVLSGQPIPGSFSQCSNTMADINTTIQQAASKYSIPANLLRAIFEIEGTEFIANPENYVCSENFAQAAGVMQITRSAYNVVTCKNERLDNDLGVCTGEENKLSRCDVSDAMELAARTLLWKAGKWVYGPGNCSATGGISASNKEEVYNAACGYYGSFAPDSLTIRAANSIPPDQRRQDGDMNYCDIVCYKMGLCPPYP